MHTTAQVFIFTNLIFIECLSNYDIGGDPPLGSKRLRMSWYRDVGLENRFLVIMTRNKRNNT